VEPPRRSQLEGLELNRKAVRDGEDQAPAVPVLWRDQVATIAPRLGMVVCVQEVRKASALGPCVKRDGCHVEPPRRSQAAREEEQAVTPAAIGQLKTAIDLIRQAMLLLDAVMQEMRESESHA